VDRVAGPLIVRPIDESRLETLHGTVSPLANAANDRGAAADEMQLDRLQLVLKRSPAQEIALRALIAQLHAPGSPSYHQWLTPEEFGAQFGPSDEDMATVKSWLASHGFSVARVNPGKATMEIAGTVAALRSAFHTQIHRYTVNGETHYANANDP
jgi:subtilase family serine protease